MTRLKKSNAELTEKVTQQATQLEEKGALLGELEAERNAGHEESTLLQRQCEDFERELATSQRQAHEKDERIQLIDNEFVHPLPLPLPRPSSSIEFTRVP